MVPPPMMTQRRIVDNDGDEGEGEGDGDGDGREGREGPRNVFYTHLAEGMSM